MESKLFLPLSCILFLASFMLPVLSQQNYTTPSPLVFLKAIQGSGRGETVMGIRDLKLYLAHFGYLNYQETPGFTDVEQDHFDEELEEAVKSYQVFYNLNATGALDGPTVSQMIMPRCGFPDKHIQKNTDNSFHTVSRYRLYPNRAKWPSSKNHLTYGFGTGFPSSFMPAVDRAFGKWATAFQYFTFSRAESYEVADLKISFESKDHGDGVSFDGPGGTLAHSFQPTNGRLHFDADESWVVGAVPGGYDLETTALHEIGHLLGLQHSDIPDAIMWPSMMAGITKGLDSDDIKGLSDLYGTSPTPVRCVKYNNVIKFSSSMCCSN